MSTKLWSIFFFIKTAFGGEGGCMSPTPQILIADSSRRKGVQNLGLSVQNYNLVFYIETAFGGTACHQPSQIWIADSARRNGVQNLGLGVQNKHKIMIYFSFSKSVGGGGGAVTCTYIYKIVKTQNCLFRYEYPFFRACHIWSDFYYVISNTYWFFCCWIVLFFQIFLNLWIGPRLTFAWAE